MEEEVLAGGVANAGRVVRVGDHVLRPTTPHSPGIHAFLLAVRAAGFAGASLPVGIDADGRERLEYIAGDVAVSPYPDWAQSDDALASIAELISSLHVAAETFDPAGYRWSTEMADPVGGPIVCHNDVCMENVVFRDGRAVGLLDFDFASPGRPVYDLAQFARMCVPVDDDLSAARLGWRPADRPARLRCVADAYGLAAGDRMTLVEVLGRAIASGGDFLRRRMEAGDPNFTALWHELGGARRFDRRRHWWAEARAEFVAALS